ncbi:MAG: M12 family metallo-peptidase [Phycisphaerales bacterium]
MIHATFAALTLLALSTGSTGSGTLGGRGAGAVQPPPCVITEVSRYREFAPALPATPTANFTVDVPTDGGVLTLDLFKHSNRSDRYRVLVDRGNGVLEPTVPPEIRTYRGTGQGRPDTVVSGSLLPGGFSGIVRLEDGETWVVQPKRDFCPNDPQAGVHLSFAAADAVPDGRGCALGQPGFPMERYTIGEQGGEGGIAGTTPSQVEIGCETDYEFFQRNGSSVVNTVNDVELIINNINTIYDRDGNIVHDISVIVVRSDVNDPYVGATIDARLTEFGNKWASAPESGIFRDISHMFSGVAFSGGTIGLAYLGVVCNGINNAQYGVVESRYTTTLNFRVSLSAHEIGHNWNCSHCDADGNANCNIMCSANGACGGISGSNLRFNSRAVTEMTNRLNAVTCDIVRPAPQVLPFLEQFASLTLQTTRWTYNDGGGITTQAVGEPSAPNSMQLNSTGNGPYDDDELRTNQLQLFGTVNPTISYWVWRSGVEAGKTFTVEYMTSGQDWVALNTLTSDGTTPGSFQQYTHTIPAAGRFNGARIRFRPDGTDTTDTWYIDDITIIDGAPSNDECSGAVDLAAGTTAFDTTTATNSASAIPSTCNADGTTTMAKDVWYRYVPACTGNALVSTCGSASFDTRLAVYAGSSCPTAGTPVLACNDEGSGCASGTSRVNFAVNAGATYWVRVGGATGGGSGSLFVSCTQTCVGDFNGDNAVDGNDLGTMLGAWGAAGGPTDLNADGVTDGTDLGQLLARWGGCGG